MINFFRSSTMFCFAMLGVSLSYLAIHSILDDRKGFREYPEKVPSCTEQNKDRTNIELTGTKNDAKLIQIQLKNGYVLETLFSSFIAKSNGGNSLSSAILDAENNSNKSLLLENYDTFDQERIIEDLVNGRGQIKMPNGNLQENFFFHCCKTKDDKYPTGYLQFYDFRCVIEDLEGKEILAIDKTNLLQSRIDIY